MMRPHRQQPLYLAFLLHRFSGIALALFLPFHFWVLSYALASPDKLDGFLSWAELPLVKFAEFSLIFLLAVHIFGGLRLMALEFLPWSPRQKNLAALSVGVSLFVSGLFFLQAV